MEPLVGSNASAKFIPDDDDDRVSLPEDFEAVMKALLETPPSTKD